MSTQVINAADAKVGFTVTCTVATWRNLMRLSTRAGQSPTMDDWSNVVARLIDADKPVGA